MESKRDAWQTRSAIASFTEVPVVVWALESGAAIALSFGAVPACGQQPLVQLRERVEPSAYGQGGDRSRDRGDAHEGLQTRRWRSAGRLGGDHSFPEHGTGGDEFALHERDHAEGDPAIRHGGARIHGGSDPVSANPLSEKWLARVLLHHTTCGEKARLAVASGRHTPEGYDTAGRRALECGSEMEPLISGRKSVLVVEDDPALRRLIAVTLSDAGFECIAAHDAEEAIRRASAADVGAAILDLNLPGMSGAELAWHLTRLAPDAHLIALSAYLENWDAGDLEDLGIATAIAKPCDLDALVSLVSGLLPEYPDAGHGPATSNSGCAIQ
jgi:CheY-like chemotaxis protein